MPHEWERELAAIWRAETDINNGSYIQFITNWGRESYVHATQAFKKIGASRMARIMDDCQAMIDEHVESAELANMRFELLRHSLPDPIVARIYDLSYEFMDYPDNVGALGKKYYRDKIGEDATG